ncbi:unnamed protein product [Schistosoma mattheei]|uniref:Uncharacterized protein n=1 Tax=Schistosoma mattheei TaxID=31246 RepID=A0A183Q2Y3_9TREM|nr:unnamed protein product [Schistosoma mattheei]
MGFELTACHVSEMNILGSLGRSCIIAAVSFKSMLVKDLWSPSLTHTFSMQSFSSSVRNLEISSLTPVTSPNYG